MEITPEVIRSWDKQTKAAIRAWMNAHRLGNLTKAGRIEAAHPDIPWNAVARIVWTSTWRWYA